LFVTGGEGNREAVLAELAADLEPDPLVRTRYKGDLVPVHGSSSSL
jgi:hypothetical protein